MRSDLQVSIFGHVDPAWSSRRFRPGREVHSVAKEAVPGHPLADHPGHHFPAMDSDGDLLRIEWHTTTQCDALRRRHQLGGAFIGPTTNTLCVCVCVEPFSFLKREITIYIPPFLRK